MTGIEWLDNDCAEFYKYGFCSAYLDDITEFYKAKKDFLLCQNENNRYKMKFAFQNALSALKAECSLHLISPGKLQELTELLKKGVL